MTMIANVLNRTLHLIFVFNNLQRSQQIN